MLDQFRALELELLMGGEHNMEGKAEIGIAEDLNEWI